MSVSVTQFPFIQGGAVIGQWVLWDFSDGPLTLAFPSSQPIGSVWIPELLAAVSLYAAASVTGTPFYTTQPSGTELVPIPQDTNTITLDVASISGLMYVYFGTANFDPFRLGALGANVTNVQAAAPITSTGGSTPTVGLQTPLAVMYGGSGSAAPSLIAGAGINISGSWPNQTITAAAAGTVTSVTASAPLASSGGNTPNISLAVPLVKAYGGTGTTTPGDVAGTGIAVAGTWPNQTITNTGLLTLNTKSGVVTITGAGGLAVTLPGGGTIQVSGSALVQTITSVDLSVTLARVGQVVDLSVDTNPQNIQKGSGSMTGATSGSTTITIPSAYANAGAYKAWVQLQGGSGQATITIYLNKLSGSQFTVTFEGDATSGATYNFDWFTIAA